MPGAPSNPFELLAGARADGKPRKKAAAKPAGNGSAEAAPRAAPPAPPAPPPRPASPPPRAPEVPQWTKVAPSDAVPRSAAKKAAKGLARPAAVAAAAPGSAFATLLALSPGDDEEERRADGAPATDPTAGYTVGAPFWQPLPETQKGGAWLVPLTGPSGNTVTTPVAPGVPRVRKGLPEGATLQLTPQEERDIIIEYKHARAMEKKHRAKGGADAKAKVVVSSPPEAVVAVAAAAASPSAPVAAPAPALPPYLLPGAQAHPATNGAAAAAASAPRPADAAAAALAALRFAPPHAAEVLSTPQPLPQFAFAVRPNPYASAAGPAAPPPSPSILPPPGFSADGSPSPARGPPPGFGRAPPGFGGVGVATRSPPPGFGAPPPPPPPKASYVPPHLRG